MLLITCPACAIRADETHFSCGGLYTDGTAKQRYYRGIVREYWVCEAGCGTWFGLARHTSNQRIYATWLSGQEPGLFDGESA